MSDYDLPSEPVLDGAQFTLDDGFSVLGAETIPTDVDVEYTDAKTVAAVQLALVKQGYDLGTSGPDKNGVDGLIGSKTRAAIKKVQAKLVPTNITGTINRQVIMALQVTPGVLPPGVTLEGRAAVQAQVAADAASQAEHAKTQADVVSASSAVVAAATAGASPDLQKAAQDALEKAKGADTPAKMKEAAEETKKVAEDVKKQVMPWWKAPAWQGGWPRWQVGVVGGGGALALAGLLAIAFGGRGGVGSGQ